ncbi:MAG: hypothetical protein HYT46_01745 [Candidatus Vogelbacteria bacterium]|nr:hypothetical protein [Candidatus Vogelbacteria bacterium]
MHFKQEFSQLWPFAAPPPYDEQGFLSNLARSIGKIRTAGYTIGLNFSIVPRDDGTKAFTPPVSDPDDLRRWQNDFQRFEELTEALDELNNAYRLSSKTSTGRSYPKELPDRTYTTTADRKNFNLPFTFETAEAIKRIKNSWGYQSTTTIIADQTVTFTKDSPHRVYFPDEPPKSFLTSLADLADKLPANGQMTTRFGGLINRPAAGDGQNQTEQNKPVDTSFNFSFNGQFDDLSIRAAAEFRKIGEDLYFRINNFPNLFFLSQLSAIKGKWVKISKTDRDNSMSFLPVRISEYNEEWRSDLQKQLTILERLWNNYQIFDFTAPPKKVKIGTEKLWQYELRLNRDNLIDFLKAWKNELGDNEDDLDEIVTALESKEAAAVFNYLQDNTTIIILINQTGWPVQMENRFRLVPRDTAAHLTGKQGLFVSSIDLKNINQPITISAPDGEIIPLKEALESLRF